MVAGSKGTYSCCLSKLSHRRPQRELPGGCRQHLDKRQHSPGDTRGFLKRVEGEVVDSELEELQGRPFLSLQ